MNPAFAHVIPSLIRAVNSRKRPGDIDLGMGEPVLPVDMRALEHALDWARIHGCPYGPNPGDRALRQAIVDHYHYPFVTQLEQVCITVGSEEAIYLALRVILDPKKDELLVLEPAYPAYDKICQVEGIPWRSVPLDPADGFAPRAQTVIDALQPQTRAILLCSPCNPTGRVWPKEELQLLAQALLSRPGPPIHIIWDEVYRELYFGDEAPASMAEFYPFTWVANSISKSHALTGMRIGWLMGPLEGMPAALKLHQLVVTSPPMLNQQAALFHFQHPESFRAHRNDYLVRKQVVEATLEEHGLTCAPMEGAFYSFVRLEGPLAQDSVKAAFALIDQAHVVTVPGRAFGESAEGWLRVSFVAPPALLWEGLRRLKQGMENIDPHRSSEPIHLEGDR